MKHKSYDTVTEAMNNLIELGYTNDFSIMIEQECLYCHRTEIALSPDEFEIDDFYRFEGDSDPGDQMIVYAISSKNKNLKGIVVSAYGLYADNTISLIVKKLDAHHEQKSMDLLDALTYDPEAKSETEEETLKTDSSTVSWGFQQYDGKIRTLLEDKQIDINNNKENYMFIQEFVVRNIDGIELKKGIVTDLPNDDFINEEE